MKKGVGVIAVIMVLLMVSGCSNSNEKDTKAILSQYFQDNKLTISVDDYKINGEISPDSIKKNEQIVINDSEITSKLSILVPSSDKSTDPTFAVDPEKKEVYKKVALKVDNETPVYVKVSPQLKYDTATKAVTQLSNDITTEVKNELTKALETNKNELFDITTTAASTTTTTSSGTNSTTADSSNTSGSASNNSTTTDSGTSGNTSGNQENNSAVNESLPTATAAFYKSLTPGMKIVLVKVETANPENYSVTYGDVVLMYNAEFSGYVGDVPEGTAESLEAVVKKN